MEKLGTLMLFASAIMRAIEQFSPVSGKDVQTKLAIMVEPHTGNYASIT